MLLLLSGWQCLHALHWGRHCCLLRPHQTRRLLQLLSGMRQLHCCCGKPVHCQTLHLQSPRELLMAGRGLQRPRHHHHHPTLQADLWTKVQHPLLPLPLVLLLLPS